MAAKKDSQGPPQPQSPKEAIRDLEQRLDSIERVVAEAGRPLSESVHSAFETLAGLQLSALPDAVRERVEEHLVGINHEAQSAGVSAFEDYDQLPKEAQNRLRDGLKALANERARLDERAP